jgi:hypothetical protein
MPKRDVYPPYEHHYAGSRAWLTVVSIAAAGWLLLVAWPWLFVLSILLTVPLAALAADQLQESHARRDAYRLRARGVQGLLVYSRSPNWQAYIEEHWLPRIAGRMEVLDLSERRNWRRTDARVRIFNRFIQGDEDYNPAAVVFRTGAPLVFRFYPAFQNAKHGNDEGLKMLEEELFRALEE